LVNIEEEGKIWWLWFCWCNSFS